MRDRGLVPAAFRPFVAALMLAAAVAAAPERTPEAPRAVAGAELAGPGEVACASARRGASACSADITGATPGQPDGVVDALDFLLLIGQWGSPCVGSCEADITGPTPMVPDGNVDALDFLLLIGTWGPCPAAPGACCLPEGGCAGITPAECSAAGGVFLGEGEQCPPGACGAGVVGACCLPNGNCVAVDVPACGALGGDYQGVGVPCAPGLCGT